MTRVLCFQTVADDDGLSSRRVYDPPHVTAACGSTLLLEPPEDATATVNGVAVISFQVLRQGDAVEIDASGRPPIRYRVGRLLPQVRPGEAESCRFTGLPITGEAVVCPCGWVYAPASARHLRRCVNPQCRLPLEEQEDPLPPEELL